MQHASDTTKWARRWLKEINDAENSKLFKAYYDKTGIINSEEPGKLYIISRAHPDSPYGNQQHVWSVKFKYGREPDCYVFPVSPPLVRCETPIFHPNISAEGSICLDILKTVDVAAQASKKPGEREYGWQMSYGLEAVFNSLQALLEDPNTGSPFNKEANIAYIKYRDALKAKTPNEAARYRKELDDHYNRKLLVVHKQMIEKILAGKAWGKDAI